MLAKCQWLAYKSKIPYRAKICKGLLAVAIRCAAASFTGSELSLNSNQSELLDFREKGYFSLLSIEYSPTWALLAEKNVTLFTTKARKVIAALPALIGCNLSQCNPLFRPICSPQTFTVYIPPPLAYMHPLVQATRYILKSLANLAYLAL